MDEIKDVIQRIIKGCGVAGLDVSEILSAFVARTVSLHNDNNRQLTIHYCHLTRFLYDHMLKNNDSHFFQVVESDTSTFALDKKKTPQEIDSIIVQSIEKLLSRDDPALEMY